MDKIESFWDKQAKGYDGSEDRFDPAFKIILEKTRKYLRPDDVVLDFGCATGSKTLEIAKNVKEIHGMDISKKMIEEAENKKVEMKVENAWFAKGTLNDNGYDQGSFDVIISYGVLHLLKDLNNQLEEIKGLLKPGGLFISTTACLKERMAFRNRVEFLMYMFIKKIRLFPLFLHMFTVDDVKNRVSDNGFEIVETESLFEGITMGFVIGKK
jgi:2-polyprenyl-3-methyl-5-hydroxy-6-metoxy-1,4-benzoquinol methylase